MKSQILLSLDHDVIYRLRQQGNMSGFVNNLLSQSLDGGDTKELVQKAINKKEGELKTLGEEIANLKEKLVKMPKYTVRHG